MLNYLYVVDDDYAVRHSLTRLVSCQSDYVVQPFASGDDFLAARHQLEPGIVLLDFHMKGTNGLAVLHALRGMADQFVTIMLTAHGGVARSVDAMKAGAHDFLEKPYDPAELMLRLEEASALVRRRQAKRADRDAARVQLARLSPREKDVLRGLIEGRPNKIIAAHLGISHRTVEIYRANLMDKLGVNSLAEALKLAFLAEELYHLPAPAAA